jgi:hypothetical protein
VKQFLYGNYHGYYGYRCVAHQPTSISRPEIMSDSWSMLAYRNESSASNSN